MVGQARYVVSDYTTDFPPLVGTGDSTEGHSAHVFKGIEYLTAVEFIQDVLGVNAADMYGRDLPRMLIRSGGAR